MCGDDSRDIIGLPIDRILRRLIEPTEAQRAALDELACASATAAQKIKAACPTQNIADGAEPACVHAATY